MLRRGAKSSYNPYATGQRVKKAKLDILPNKHSVWLKQVRRPGARRPRGQAPGSGPKGPDGTVLMFLVERVRWRQRGVGLRGSRR